MFSFTTDKTNHKGRSCKTRFCIHYATYSTGIRRSSRWTRLPWSLLPLKARDAVTSCVAGYERG